MSARPRLPLRSVALALLLAVVPTAPAAACSVCFGNADPGTPLLTGARLGVFLLLGITGAVLAGCATFFVYLSRRARQAESDGIASEWARLQRSSPP